MLTLSDVWKHLTKGNTTPEALSGVTIREISVDPRHGGTGCLLVLLPDHSSPDLLTQAVDRGVVGLVASERTLVDNRITWLDTDLDRESHQDILDKGVVGFIVRDTRLALLSLAELWRSKIQALVVCILGAEGLRTAQRMTRAVLSQRFRTLAPDFLCCDPHSLAEALLSAHVETERLLLRVNLQNEESLDFLNRVVSPHIVAVTNTFPAKNDGTGDNRWLEKYLAEGLPPATLLVINADDAVLQSASAHVSTTVFSYGLRPQPFGALWASGIESEGREGLRLRMHYRGEVVYVRIPLLGRYSVHTALAASAVGLISEQSWEEIVAGLRTMTAQLHLIMTPGYNGSTFLEDSYAASPASTLSLLNLLEDFSERKVAVLGDMLEIADQEIEGHKKVGNRVADVASWLITHGRLGHVIAQEAIDCGMAKDAVYIASGNEDVVKKLREIVKPTDIVLVSGSGQLHLKEIVDELIDTQASMCEV